MKLATIADGTRDGRLVVVSRDLAQMVDARAIAPTLQKALDDWVLSAPALEALATALEVGKADTEPFDETAALSPLPRAYQWIDGSAYLGHVELVRKARGAEMPPSLYSDPLMYQGGSDSFLGPREPIRMADENFGIDLEAEVAVVLGDVPMGADRATASEAIRLVLLVNDVSLRNLVPTELAKGFGFFQSKPSSAFSPVAVTPGELGAAWDGGRLHLPLLVGINGVPFGRADAGRDMNFDFPALVVHAARTRPLAAGTILGSGTVSNKAPDGTYSLPVGEGGVGYSCLAELRMVETLRFDAAKTPFLHFGDEVRIEMKDSSGRSIFGAIEQKILPLGAGDG
jgi:fumarylacetoacetate (FAA) hydrolase